MAILAPNRNVWRIERAHRVAVLIDGAAFFGAVRQAALAAERSIAIMGWDLDSRTRLVGETGAADDGYPIELADFLSALVAERPHLRVYLLLWDYSILYASEREPLPALSLQWNMPPQVLFSLDGDVPASSAQHQKIVVIDDKLAFCGGLDLTSRRWDTSDHTADNPKRVDLAGTPYRPFHDVQAMVDGDAARALSDIVKERWRSVTTERLATVEAANDPWPSRVRPDFIDVEVGIARTQPAFADQREVREVEALFMDSIAAAQRFIYIENQFLTSSLIAQCLARRMVERPDLEVLLVGPQTYETWLEARTMRNGRIRFMRTLAEAGVADRARLLYPHVSNGRSCVDTMMHSKVMIVDDRLLRVGSANLNNRSMGTDTECDIVIEAQGERVRQQISAVRDRLIADHCGTEPKDVAQLLGSGKGLLETAQALSGRGHSLRAVDDGSPDPLEMSHYIERIADPERPIAAAAFASLELGGRLARPTATSLPRLVGVLMLALALTLVWKLMPVSEALGPTTIEEAMAAVRSSAWAPAYVLAAFLAGGLVAFPLVLLIIATAAAFGPVLGFCYAAVGSMASAALTYWIGAWLGRRPLQNVLGPRINRIRERICRSGVVAVAAIRLLPIAPFTIVNLAAGASGIRFIDYMVGTLLGLLPGLLTLSILGYQIFRIALRPTTSEFLLLAAALVLWLTVVIGAQSVATRSRRPQP